MQILIGYACLAAALICAAIAWGEYCWRLALVSVVLIAVGGLCLSAPARAQGTPPCAVQVVIDLSTYEGAKHYENLCLSSPASYGDGLLMIEAVGVGDGIFKSGFEVWP